MNPQATPRKTDLALKLLASRSALLPGHRMLLITVDGKKTVAELQAVERALGLQGQGLASLLSDGLLDLGPQAATVLAAVPDQALKLVRAKMFALDLAGRMLAGKDLRLREAARGVDTESRFLAWMDECAAEIASAADAERASLFRQRVASVAQ